MQQSNTFCSAPWIGMYYHTDQISPCCYMRTNENLVMTPNEYRNSEWLKSLKQEFLDGKRPSVCKPCWEKEDRGLQSVRTKWPTHNPDNGEKITWLEIRESNLCNFKCRSCNPNDSSLVQKEIEENPELIPWFPKKTTMDSNISDEAWSQILDLSIGLESLTLTGGEPMLIKRYYDLLDHLIANGRNEDLILRVYTNCSVWNPIFMEKFLKFKRAELKLSIDGVGKSAEYQRHGTKWDIVRENVFKFAELPISIGTHSVLSAYSLLTLSSLTDFLLEIVNYPDRKANLINFSAQAISTPASIQYNNLNVDLRIRAIKEIDEALKKIESKPETFRILINELVAVKSQLLIRHDCYFDRFVATTKGLDKIRNQSFEEVFNYKI